MAVVIVVAIVIIAVVLIIYLLSRKVFSVAVGAKNSKEKVFESNQYDRAGTDRSATEQNREWLRSQALEEHRITSFDGLSLLGRILHAPGQSHKWVIILHGFSGNGLLMGNYARHFYERGYNVLLPDMRGCGESDGNYMGMGWLDSRDMPQWVDVILSKDKEAKIVLTGGSMGGAAVMMTTGQSLPENVVAAIEDCGYTSVWEEYTIQLKKVFGLPAFPFMYIVDHMTKKKAGYSFREASSTDMLKKSKTPTLFIHGTEDSFVPYSMLDENYNAAACEKQKLSIEGAGHGVSAEVDPKLYWDTVDAFLAKYVDEKGEKP